MKRISGQQIPQHIGDEVIILGTVNRVASSGNSLELQTLDEKIVNVSLNNPVDGNLEGYVEVHGVLQSKATLACSNYIHFPPEMCKDFEPKQYNEYLTIANLLGKDKWKMSATDTPLQ